MVKRIYESSISEIGKQLQIIVNCKFKRKYTVLALK